VCAEASTVLRAVAADFFCNCWCLVFDFGCYNCFITTRRTLELYLFQKLRQFLVHFESYLTTLIDKCQMLEMLEYKYTGSDL
jgi:hypothetical protein